MNINVKLIILLLIFLIHCSKNNDVLKIAEISNTIDLKPTFVCSTNTDDIDLPNLLLKGNEPVLTGFSITKKNKYLLKAFDKNLKTLTEKTFTIGNGPGEVGGGPRFFSINNQYYALDNTQLRISIFDKNLNFIRFVNATLHFYSPLFSNDGKYFIYNMGEYEADVTISVYRATFPGLEKKIIHTFPSFPKLVNRKHILGAGSIHYFLKDNKLYLLSKDDYLISKYDISGKLEKQVQVDYKKIKVPSDMHDTWVKEQQEGQEKHKAKIILPDIIQPCSWMIPLGRGFIVIRRYDYSTECSGLVEADYFTFKLELLGKAKFPCFTEIFTVERNVFRKNCIYINGYIYLTKSIERDNDEFLSIEKWKISEDEIPSKTNKRK